MGRGMMRKYLKQFGISEKIEAITGECEKALAERFTSLSSVCEENQYKVLSAFSKNRLSDAHFGFATGYGYDDPGRDVTERIFADVFGAEAALVRTQIVCGTHALSITFSGILRPGEKLLYCTGMPYDSLLSTIGIGGEGAGQGTLSEFGIGYSQVGLTADGSFDYEALETALKDPSVRMAAAQRATGYSARGRQALNAITIEQLSEWARFVKKERPDVVLMADNCYGEFIETLEPTEIGVDIMAGSLIKNPGGGLALSGGYVAGRADLVDKVAYRLTCPGIGGECGLTFGQTRTMLQGLFLAPRIVMDAVKGAILCGAVFERLGFEVFPDSAGTRADIIETIRLGSPEALIAFCKGIQAISPVDTFVTPEPWGMPGYRDKVIMASGAFVTGSSIELSADGPLREPYNVYFQGGLTYEHAKLGVMSAAQHLIDIGIVGL